MLETTAMMIQMSLIVLTMIVVLYHYMVWKQQMTEQNDPHYNLCTRAFFCVFCRILNFQI